MLKLSRKLKLHTQHIDKKIANVSTYGEYKFFEYCFEKKDVRSSSWSAAVSGGVNYSIFKLKVMTVDGGEGDFYLPLPPPLHKL